MKTYTITGYQACGTCDSSAYFVDVTYRGELLQRFSGDDAASKALFYVAREAGRAIVNMWDRA